MAASMAGHYGKILQIVAGVRLLSLRQCPQPTCVMTSRSMWSSSLFRKDSDNVGTTASSSSPRKPKQPPSPFVLFLMRNEAEVKRKNPDFSRKEIVSQVATLWRELDPEAKARLSLERAESFDKYKKEMKEYRENITPEQLLEETRIKKKKKAQKLYRLRHSLGMPQRPCGAFPFFLQDRFKERGDAPSKEYFKKCIDEWSNMDPQVKAKYEQRSTQMSEQYAKEMDAWEAEMIKLGKFDVLRISTVEKLKQEKMEEKKKRKRSKSQTKKTKVKEEDEYL